MSNETYSESNVQCEERSVPAIDSDIPQYSDSNLQNEHEEERAILDLNTQPTQERDDLIPCEFCDHMIPFDEYEEHQTICMHRSIPQYSVLYNDHNNIYRIDITPMIQAFNALNLHQLGGSNLTQDDEEDNDYEDPNENDVDHEQEEIEDDPDDGEYVPQAVVRHTSLILLPRLLPILDPNEQETDDEFNYRYFSLLSERLGTVKVGLSNPEAALEKIAANTDAAEKCPICQDAILSDKLVKTKCGHFYCNECIVKWLKEHVACPVCNKDQRDLLDCDTRENVSLGDE